ncbi:hypothetical protein GA0074692_6768 [Micromonospora pallida]|uniref:Uncharacterized protein n=1 Tax=Micromonospora pallida TaxID=145854 RepID=A0A1C6TNA7_9ACTN|nr:hypothetical protein GA0074692_6768 [Micromonospora pallida]
MRGIALAAPEVAGLLLVTLLVAAIWWWGHRADRGWPRRRALGAHRTAGPGVRPGPALTAAAGLVAVVSALALGWPGDAGPGTYALITVLFLGWVSAAAVCAALAAERARTARYRAMRAAAGPLPGRGRAVDDLAIPEVFR